MVTMQHNALVTPQWRDAWDDNEWDMNIPNGEPKRSFLTFVMKASDLRVLSGVFRRSPGKGVKRQDDLNIQRPHETTRSKEIRRFVELGYPMSNMSTNQLKSADKSLQRPGWLPTAVVVNVLQPGETRDGLLPLSYERAIVVPPLDGLPGGTVVEFKSEMNPAHVRAEETPPFEVIDGQHRLWAFEDDEDTDDFYLPVVAFIDLSKAHQAYLFWSINIKPKRINTSLAFDLYPILRSQEWLMQGEGLKVYRESRAQELTEALWSTPSSPWYDRINMIGARGVGHSQPVSQASFVRSFLASFVKKWDIPRTISGGLFGNDDDGGLDWNRAQQAAFVIAAWRQLQEQIIETMPIWFQALGDNEEMAPDVFGRYSMLASDQGVRAYMLVINELSYRLRNEVDLRQWQIPPSGEAIDPAQVEEALATLRGTSIDSFLSSIAAGVAEFDWRSNQAPGFTPDEVRSRSAYKGSGGYIALRNDIYRTLAVNGDGLVAQEAKKVLALLEEGSADV